MFARAQLTRLEKQIYHTHTHAVVEHPKQRVVTKLRAIIAFSLLCKQRFTLFIRLIWVDVAFRGRWGGGGAASGCMRVRL